MTQAQRRPAVAVDRARRAAFDTLLAVDSENAYANLVLPRFITQAKLTSRDAGLATELGYGTLRSRGTLDEILRRCLTQPPEALELPALNLLRLGAYQLLKTRIPPHAAVATTVDLARATKNDRVAGLINAVLRKVSARTWEDWCADIGAAATPRGRLALRYSHPGWIVAAFDQALADGETSAPAAPQALATPVVPEAPAAELEQALAADEQRPIVHLAAWPGAISRAELVLQSGGEPGPYSPYAVRLAGGQPGDIPAVRDGLAGVQDEGSQLCAVALAELPLTGPDERWLDLCAGPGGKAALLAGLAVERGATLTANELHPHRAALVRQATKRWDVAVTTGDARFLQPDERGYDRILLDAPCTGLGALRRRPDARWRRDVEDLADLVRLQAALLRSAARLLRPGGVLGYVACSPHPAETTGQIAEFTATQPQFGLPDVRPLFAGVPQLGRGPWVQLWPHRHGTDAMFFAGLVKAG